MDIIKVLTTSNKKTRLKEKGDSWRLAVDNWHGVPTQVPIRGNSRFTISNYGWLSRLALRIGSLTVYPHVLSTSVFVTALYWTHMYVDLFSFTTMFTCQLDDTLYLVIYFFRGSVHWKQFCQCQVQDSYKTKTSTRPLGRRFITWRTELWVTYVSDKSTDGWMRHTIKTILVWLND